MKSDLKILEEINSIGLGEPKNSYQHPWQVLFLLKRIILEQQQRLDELEYEIAKIRGEVEPEEE